MTPRLSAVQLAAWKGSHSSRCALISGSLSGSPRACDSGFERPASLMIWCAGFPRTPIPASSARLGKPSASVSSPSPQFKFWRPESSGYPAHTREHTAERDATTRGTEHHLSRTCATQQRRNPVSTGTGILGFIATAFTSVSPLIVGTGRPIHSRKPRSGRLHQRYGVEMRF